MKRLLDWPVTRREDMDGVKVYLGDIGWVMVALPARKICCASTPKPPSWIHATRSYQRRRDRAESLSQGAKWKLSISKKVQSLL